MAERGGTVYLGVRPETQTFVTAGRNKSVVVVGLSQSGKTSGINNPTLLVHPGPAVATSTKLDTLEDVLRQEYRTTCGALRSHDFEEGIRAQVIDKDRNPKWSPASLAAVTTADVEAYFAPADRELEFS